MSSLTDHQSSKITKLLLLGDSGTGKTGSLVSLALAGYKLRILDFDNGLDSLVHQIRKRDASKLANVDYVTLRDKWKSSPSGPILDGSPTAFIEGTKHLDNWPGLGKPAEWGSETILVLDSLTHFSNAALNWAGVFKFSKDGRAVFFEAQKAIEYVVSLLSSETFKTNVIVVCHVRYVQRDDGVQKGYPMTAGEALSPKIPTYFNTLVQMETVGVGSNARRQLTTIPNGLVDLKSPTAIAKTYGIENGMAELFKDLRGES